MTIRESIIQLVQRQEEKIFLVDAVAGAAMTYGEFHNAACALAAELSRRGLHKGDRAAVMIPNCCELAIFYFACIYLGAVVVPINPLLSKADVQFILANCKPNMLAISQSSTISARGLHANVVRLATAQDENTVEPAAGFDLVRIRDLKPSGQFAPLEAASDEDLIAIMYTSGTSAKPKGLAHKLGSMMRNARSFAAVQHIDEDSRFYLTLSMAYMGGFYNLLILPFLCGASVVVDHVFDARSSFNFWEKAKTHGVNTLWMAPTVLSILLRMDRGHTGEEFCRRSVRHAFVGFAPLALKVKAEFELRYGVRLIENYGLSETLFVTARSQNAVGGQGYVGEALPGVKLRIADPDGRNDVQRNDDPPESDQAMRHPGTDSSACRTEGEVKILTPDLMAGYLEADGTLSPIDSAQWFATGDLGRLENDGSLFITGRQKDLIIRGGVNISPAAIEESLMQVEGVAEVAVISIPHELYGEDVVAVMKLNPGFELESMLDLLIAHGKCNLAQHQQPARYITIDEFPRTANGKVQKARIRELLAEKLQLSVVSAAHKRATAIEEPAGVSC
jgi:long-chain acyl-CoA synthetase